MWGRRTFTVHFGCPLTSSEEGGQNLAILFSFSETCKANKVNFRLWLQDVLPRLNSTPASQFDSLLPHLWQPSEK